MSKNGRVMPIENWGKSGVLAYFWLNIGYFGHIFWDLDFNLFCPTIHININRNPIRSQLDPNGPYYPLKWTKVAISRFAFFRKTRLLKTLRLFHFSIFFHEIFRTNVQLNFALNLLLGFFLIFQNKFSGQILKYPGELQNLAAKFFWNFLNSQYQVKCEI